MYDNNYYFEPFSTPLALSMLLNLHRSHSSAKYILRDILSDIREDISGVENLPLKNSYIYINFDNEGNVNGSWQDLRKESRRLRVYK